MVVHDSPAGRRIVFVEVKKTADGSYISDSVYKALGYISDFRDLWGTHSSNPKIVVLFPEGIGLKQTALVEDQEVVLASAFDRSSLQAALRSGLDV
jgi:hypothetical protein